MRGSTGSDGRERAKRMVFACSVVIAMLVAGLASVGVVGETAEARGPAYGGPQTQSTGPAYFGPAPNPYPYCDSPTYFDPFPENVNPIGRMDIGSTASVTTNGLTMDLVITSEGNPGTQYPGFFPNGADGTAGDQPKGIELAEGDGATVTLSAPLFYSQWIFTDVDQPDEGFTVTPNWTQQGEAAVFAGDDSFTFAGTTNNSVILDDTNGVSEASESINGRAQVDFLGAVTGIQMLRTDPSNGQSGFAVGGGCVAVGAAKALVAGPTWNGTGFDVTYELRMRNNLPSSATIQSVINDAIGAVGGSLVTGTPQGIPLENLQLTDDLSDPAFSNVTVNSLTTNGGLTINSNFDGVTDVNLLAGGSIPAEQNEVLTLSVTYTPDLASGNWNDCSVGYDYLNQTQVTATAANVNVDDLSDDGTSAQPSNDNGSGGVDDPTPVNFPCPPGELEIVKTVIPGPNGTCPTFDNGVPGDGPALPVIVDDIVTYCVSVRNSGAGPVTNVVVSDSQAPSGDISLPDLAAGQETTTSYDVQVDIGTPPLNTATANGDDASGPLDPVSDTALIQVSPKPQPLLEIVKTVLEGPNATCPSFENGVQGLGPALLVDDGDIVTYCISVRNTGPGLATNVVITDPQAPNSFTIGTLGTGQGDTVSYDLPVDLTIEEVNTATANYDGPDGPRDPVSDDAQIDVQPLEPSLEIVKTVVEGPGGTCPTFDNGVPGLGTALAVDDGDTVTYCISVRNTGPGIATDVVVSDDQAPGGDFAIGTLAAGAEETVSYDIPVDLNTPTVNTAFADGNGPTGPLDQVDDPAQITVDPLPDPNLEIVKTALVGPNATCPDFDGGTPDLGDAVAFLEGETVTYCVTVRNTGAGSASDVVITDDQAPSSFDLTIGDLAPGAEATVAYDVPDLTVSTETTNTAFANGTGLNGPLPEISDPALISVSLQPDPVLEIVKTVVPGPNGTCPATFADGVLGDGDPLPVTYGDTVTYCISVRNTGDNPATSVVVTDGQAPAALQLGTVGVGEEVSDSYDVEVDDTTPVLNTATVNGTGPNGPVPSDSDTALIDPKPIPDPVLEIVKTVVLGPNGTCPDFANGVQGPGDPLTVAIGQVVTYCVSIQNTGLGDATNVVISDDQAEGQSPFDIGDLPAGEGRSISYDVEVTPTTGLRNVATVTGEGPNEDPDPDDDDALIDARTANVSLIHSVSKADEECITVAKNLNSLVANMETLPITWCALITNNGAVPLTNVVLTVPDIGDGEPVDVLAGTGSNVLQPDESVRVEVPGEIPDTGLVSNGQVTGDPSDDDGNVLTGVPSPSDEDDAEVREASINIETTVAAGADADCADSVEVLLIPSDQDITWCFVVTNTGAVDLLVTRVTDPVLGITAFVPEGQQVLRVGESIALQANGISADGLVIDADVRGKPLDFDGTVLDQAPEVEDIDPAQVIVPSADLAIVKTNSNSVSVPLGGTLTYTLVVTNNGPNRARNVVVTDRLPTGVDYVTLPGGPDWACALDADERGFSCLKGSNLPAGASVTLTYIGRINQAAVPNTDLVNTARVSSDTPDDDPTNNEDTSTTRTPDQDPVVPGTPVPTPAPPGPEYPGPFTPPAPPLDLPEPDEVLGLAVTGSSSGLLAMLSAAMMVVGGFFTVGARRSREEDED